MTRLDLTGQKFYRLTVIEPASSRNGLTRWKCLCKCGLITVVHTSSLTTGHTRSCGCAVKGTSITHGMKGTVEYRAWQLMKNRCYNRRSPDFMNWGGRGIKVCDRWLSCFENFYEDMGSRPASKSSLGRIDHDGDYEPGNCRWENSLEQGGNTIYTVEAETV